MKNIKYLIFIILGIWLFASCEEDFENPVLHTDEIVPPGMTMGFTDLVMTEQDTSNTVEFSWTPVEYNLDNTQAPTYKLQLKHVDSTDYFELASTTETPYTTTVKELNSKIVKEGFPVDVALDFQLRVLSFIQTSGGGSQLETPSDVVDLQLTAFEAVVEPAYLWVPGDYQGWGPGEAPNVYSPEDNGIYNGYIHFPPGGTFEFKFTSDPDWDHTNYGSGGDGVLDTDDGAGNLSVDGTGTYYMTVNTNDLTWSNELRNFALTGTFNSWGDEALTWDDTDQVFTVTVDLDANAEFKWRANGDDNINLGASAAGDGTLVPDGSNITVSEAGNYTITLDLYQMVPTYEIIQN